MARKFPRFLFSNPSKSKSTGPFIVHCIFPKCIFKVVTEEKNLTLELLDCWEELNIKSMEDERVDYLKNYVAPEALYWLKNQIANRQIKL